MTGRHLIAEFYGCDLQRMENKDDMASTIRLAVSKANMTLVDLVLKKFEPQGLTILAMLEESHISIHTSPELDGYAAFDCYTCGKGDPELAFEVIKEYLQPREANSLILTRGVKHAREKESSDSSPAR